MSGRGGGVGGGAHGRDGGRPAGAEREQAQEVVDDREGVGDARRPGEVPELVDGLAHAGVKHGPSA
jgi:hypothetical protein